MSSPKYDNGWYELLFLRKLLQAKKWQRRSSHLNEINTDIKQFRKNVKTTFFEKKSFLNSLKLIIFHFLWIKEFLSRYEIYKYVIETLI